MQHNYMALPSNPYPDGHVYSLYISPTLYMLIYYYLYILV